MGGADPAPKPTRRAFSPAYKLAMVAEYESAPNGEKGALLRREGLYSSHIIEWTRARDAGPLGKPEGREPASALSGPHELLAELSGGSDDQIPPKKS